MPRAVGKNIWIVLCVTRTAEDPVPGWRSLWGASGDAWQ